MTENERVKELRKARGLTLEKFGKALGIQSSAVSKIERGETRLTPQNRLSICREFGVREEWLRDGTGEMEDAAPADELHRIVSEYGFPDEVYAFLSEFIRLTEPEREAVLRYVRAVVARLNAAEPEAPGEADRFGMTREQYHAELDRQLDDEEKAGERSSASGQLASGFKMA